jgi:hypothetical protein
VLPRQRSLARQPATHRGSVLGSKPERADADSKGEERKVIRAEDAATDVDPATEDPIPGHAANRLYPLGLAPAPVIHVTVHTKAGGAFFATALPSLLSPPRSAGAAGATVVLGRRLGRAPRWEPAPRPAPTSHHPTHPRQKPHPSADGPSPPTRPSRSRCCCWR